MGDNIPNMIGTESGLGDKIAKTLFPGYMPVGREGMAEHGIHVDRGMVPVPRNSIPMVGKQGPFGYITMGGFMTSVSTCSGSEM